jgi:hypothetical protein
LSCSRDHQRPLWIKSCRDAIELDCLLYPQERLESVADRCVHFEPISDIIRLRARAMRRVLNPRVGSLFVAVLVRDIDI